MFVNASAFEPTPERGRGAAILYSRHGITVTVDHLVVAGRRYPVAQLTDLRTTRGTAGVGLRAAQVTAMTLAALAGGIAASGAAGGRTALLIFGAAVAVVAAVLLGLARAARRRRGHQLWARHRGVDLLVYTTADAREFGQVTRAIRRAREVAVRDAALAQVALPQAALRRRPRPGLAAPPTVSSPPAGEPPPVALR